MKIFSIVVIVLAIFTLVFNVLKLNFEAPFEGESSVALIGILASLCAIVLMLILMASKKIADKIKE
jgi:Mg2+ and Co2+ transporter CorA